MLAELVEGARADAQTRRDDVSLVEVERLAAAAPPALDVLEFLRPADRVKILAEVKRASPSRGRLADIPDPAALAVSYETGGASAISVLTEERRFGGSLADLREVRAAVGIPVLRKDFLVDEYQVLEARAAGADLVLLIVAALDQARLARLFELTSSLGMAALVETHDADEVSRALDVGAAVIGVNARDLSTFELDQDLFGRLADSIPGSVIRVAESAVRTASDVAHYRRAGADVVLVGEALVTGDPVATLQEFLAA
ncbi:indole-3-glycerol phosphate synthase TrpC [Naasia sp.]|uniref:indole-3-glycerol phosphate synthase TrpC n=1 Tax=Naasia sp. TaxID=2546198 RepID=UPI002603FF3D|nr:indole-3-glycerol phosphate synthase TrpC [Naasia sp.]